MCPKMYTKEILIKLIKKSRKLYKENNMSWREIAKKLHVSKDSVYKRIKMEFTDEINIKIEYKEKRWFKSWKFRKYSQIVQDRIKDIYNKMIDEKKFFINEYTILENYIKLYAEDTINKKPNLYYIQYVQKKLKLHKKSKKPFRNWLSKYMQYPENTINKLGYIMELIDFIWPRFLAWDSTPYHFLSRRYIRPEKNWQIDIINSQTTEQTIQKLASDRELRPIPQVLKIDNDSAFGMLKSWKTKDCIWSFTKRLLYLGISPLYSVPREPWNNWNVEWQNSIFNQPFWQEILFDSPAHLKTEVVRFNTKYKQYSDLVSTSKEDMEKLQITQSTILDFCDKYNIDKEQLVSKKYYEKLDKKDFKTNKIYILRKVLRIWEKQAEDEIWQIEILWNNINLNKSYINSIVFCEIDIKEDILTISQEIEWVLNTIKSIHYKVKNI